MWQLKRFQAGVTLIELMIGLVVSMIVIAGATAVYITTVSAGADTVRLARLNQDARAIMEILSSEIRRTGYCWPNDSGNPLPECDRSDPALDIRISDNGQCIRYFYQRADDSSNSSDHVAGFMLDGDAVRMSRSGGEVADGCDGGSWVALNDSSLLRIESLDFSSAGSQCRNVTAGTHWPDPVQTSGTEFPCVSPASFGENPAEGDRLFESRQIVIDMNASDARNANIQINLSETVKIRNNRVTSAP